MKPEEPPQSGLVILPDAQELRYRLTGIIDQADGIELFYSQIVERLEGSELAGPDFVATLIFATIDYTKPLPETTRQLVIEHLPQYIKSVIDDEIVRQDAMNYWQELTDSNQLGEPTS